MVWIYVELRANLSKLGNLCYFCDVNSRRQGLTRLTFGSLTTTPPPAAAHCQDVDATQPPDCCQMVDFKVNFFPVSICKF